MPVLRVDDQRAGGPRGRDLGVGDVDHRVRVAHVEAAVRVGEVVLHVDDDQRSVHVIRGGHTPKLFAAPQIRAPAGDGVGRASC
jgi:hypothetical protein